MDGGPDIVPDDALENIAYLARSANRVILLETLAEEAYTRRELHEVTGVARTTIGRIINEFEKRSWVERTGEGTYTATRTGELVVGEFRPLINAMDSITTLGDAAAWIPVEELSISIQHFGDATVRRGDPNAPFELVEYLADQVREADRFRTLTFLAPPSPVGEAMHEGVATGGLTAEHVLAGGLVEHLRTSEAYPPRWNEYVEAGARVYCYDGHVPCNLFVVDELVLIMNDRPEAGGAAIESGDRTVREALDELFETYREDAVQVDAAQFG